MHEGTWQCQSDLIGQGRPSQRVRAGGCKRYTHAMEWTDVQQRITAGEDRCNEFKRGLEFKQIGPAICAFANTRGGVVVPGVDDAGRFVGARGDTRATANTWRTSCITAAMRPCGPIPGTARRRRAACIGSRRPAKGGRSRCVRTVVYGSAGTGLQSNRRRYSCRNSTTRSASWSRKSRRPPPRMRTTSICGHCAPTSHGSVSTSRNRSQRSRTTGELRRAGGIQWAPSSVPIRSAGLRQAAANLSAHRRDPRSAGQCSGAPGLRDHRFQDPVGGIHRPRGHHQPRRLAEPFADQRRAPRRPNAHPQRADGALHAGSKLHGKAQPRLAGDAQGDARVQRLGARDDRGRSRPVRHGDLPFAAWRSSLTIHVSDWEFFDFGVSMMEQHDKKKAKTGMRRTIIRPFLWLKSLAIMAILAILAVWAGGWSPLLPTPGQTWLAVKNTFKKNNPFQSLWSTNQSDDSSRRIVLAWWDRDEDGSKRDLFYESFNKVHMDSPAMIERSAYNSPTVVSSDSRSKNLMKEKGGHILKKWDADLVILGRVLSKDEAHLWFQPCEKMRQSKIFSCGKPRGYPFALNGKSNNDLSSWIEKALPSQNTYADVPETSEQDESELGKGIPLFTFSFDKGGSIDISKLKGISGNPIGWEVVNVGAESTGYSANLIPEGNPPTGGYIKTQEAELSDINVSDYSEVQLSFYKKSTSNPRPKSVHNCDSSFDVHYRIDDQRWNHKMSYCGSYPGEGNEWGRHALQFDTNKATEISFRFSYGIQNTLSLDAEALARAEYLIDQIGIIGYSK